MCLAHSAGATLMSTRLADMQDDAPAIGRYVHTLLSCDPLPSISKGSEANPIHVYMDLLQQLLSAVGGERMWWIIKSISKYINIELIPIILRLMITYRNPSHVLSVGGCVCLPRETCSEIFQ